MSGGGGPFLRGRGRSVNSCLARRPSGCFPRAVLLASFNELANISEDTDLEKQKKGRSDTRNAPLSWMVAL